VVFVPHLDSGFERDCRRSVRFVGRCVVIWRADLEQAAMRWKRSLLDTVRHRIAACEKPVSTFSRNALLPFDTALLLAKSRYPPFRFMLSRDFKSG
jgi:hypothetical protein